jgi:hypothetical protein
MVVSPSVWAQSSIQVGQVRQGSLTETDKRLDSDGSRYDWYVLQGRSGQRVKIELKSPSFKPYLVLLDRDGTELMSHCGGPEGQPARIEMTLPYTGRYHIRVNSLHKDGVGRYTLSIMETS